MPEFNDVQLVLEREHLQQLLSILLNRGYRVIGPIVEDGVIKYDDLTSLEELPIGWADEQSGGRYRLKRRDDEALFGYGVGPQSWKQFLFPPVMSLWQANKTNGIRISPQEQEQPRLAFFGVRPCELHAIAIQDKVFLGGNQIDAPYAMRREGLFIVAVNCGQAGGTCFCESMHTGPEATSGFDLSLTEVITANRHYFVVTVGSEQGEEVVNQLPQRIANEEERQSAEAVVSATRAQMGRTVNADGMKELLYHNVEHSYWDSIAQRCLSCANCTMVCPTCFCSNVEDVTDLTGSSAERVRRWDSCFTNDFSYIHGSSVRSSGKARYRQWLMHKFAYWIDQFGSPGCVGCGRCITWCPVGIDIAAEVNTIRATFTAPPKSRKKVQHENT